MKKLSKLYIATGCIALSLSACSDNDPEKKEQIGTGTEVVGKAVGNFSADEWYPGGQLGTTDNITAGCYEDESPAVEQQGLLTAFNLGEASFERNFTTSTLPFRGLGPAYLRASCIDCHPGYGHGKRQTRYNSGFGNGYLLAIYHPLNDNSNPGGTTSNNGPFIKEVTGMPQTQAMSPFLPPVDDSKINIEWKEVTGTMPSGVSATQFPDGEKFQLIYPEVTIPTSAFNTQPQPTDIAVRLESTIGVIGTGMLDAIPDDSIIAQYKREAAAGVSLNPLFWDTGTNDMAATAWYTFSVPGRLADGTPIARKIKRFTYALTRASLQDGPGSNAVWNITNVSRSDRPNLYTTEPWAKAMSENSSVIDYIKANGKSEYSYLHAYYGDGSTDSIKACVYNLLQPTTNQFGNKWYNFKPEMDDDTYYAFMVWHRGLSIPRARNLDNPEVQRGKQLFTQWGCARCHRPTWHTTNDNYWVSDNIRGRELPRYAHQTIHPYTDMVQHRLFMVNDIHGSWCRTTPLWGRGLSMANTGAEDRLHDCRARNEVEAILWHMYSKQSDAYRSASNFYQASKADRDAMVKFLKSI